MNGVRPPQRGGRHLGQPEVADLALVDELGHRSDRVLDGRVRVHPVQVVEIDRLDTEATEAGLAGLPDVLGAARPPPRSSRAASRIFPNFVATITWSRRPGSTGPPAPRSLPRRRRRPCRAGSRQVECAMDRPLALGLVRPHRRSRTSSNSPSREGTPGARLPRLPEIRSPRPTLSLGSRPADTPRGPRGPRRRGPVARASVPRHGSRDRSASPPRMISASIIGVGTPNARPISDQGTRPHPTSSLMYR